MMTATSAVANLHLHLEYDSDLDVIAAAMAAIPDTGDSAAEHRAQVSRDVPSALAHLLDIDAIAPEGSPLRVVEASLHVSVDADGEVDSHGSPLAESAEIDTEARALVDTLGLSDSALTLIAQAELVSETAGPPPFELGDALPDTMQVISDWGITCGYLARACSFAIDRLFDDLAALADPAQSPGALSNWLPAKWRASYTPLFHRRFIVAMTDVTTQIVRGWVGPASIAQALAMAYLVDSMEQLTCLDGATLRPGMLDALRARLVDTELIDAVREGADPDVAFDEWFVTFFDELPVAPYAAD